MLTLMMITTLKSVARAAGVRCYKKLFAWGASTICIDIHEKKGEKGLTGYKRYSSMQVEVVLKLKARI